jgi:hypothetical protein
MLVVLAKANDNDSSESERLFYKNFSNVSEIINSNYELEIKKDHVYVRSVTSK